MKKINFFIVILITIAVAVAVFSYFEYFQSKSILLSILKSESNNLIKALKYSIENNIKTNEIIEDEIQNSLVSTSALADHINTHHRFTKKTINNFAKTYEVDFVLLYDKLGLVHNLNIPDSLIFDKFANNFVFIKNENYYWLELGVIEIDNVEYYLIGGVFEDDNTIIISGIEERKLLDLRKSVGIGVLLNNYKQNKDIIYVALQDTFGLIAATKDIQAISTIQADNFLDSIYNSNKLSSRITDYNNNIVLETATTLNNNEHKILVRLGLSLEKFESINQKNKNRTIFLAIGIFVVIAGSFAFIYQSARHNKLKEDHKLMLDYTGLLLSNINEAVIGIDKNCSIIIYNHKAETLFGRAEIGSNYIRHFNKDFLELFETLKNYINSEYNEIEYQSPNNQNFILAYSKSIALDETGNPNIAIAVIRDITQIRESEILAQRNEKLAVTGELAAGVAHEIRNPMNAINVIAQRLVYEFEPKNDEIEYQNLVGIIRNEIQRIDVIIAQFIEFSKLKQSVLVKQDLNIPIQKAINLLKHSADLQKINIINNCNENLFAMIDVHKLEQVFINLIKNSIDAINQNGEIVISSELSNQKITISIKDNGCGIAENIKKKIFDLYFTSKSKGTGLGLGIVNKIIQEHNGKIHFESEINKGTTFYLEFERLNNGKV